MDLGPGAAMVWGAWLGIIIYICIASNSSRRIYEMRESLGVGRFGALALGGGLAAKRIGIPK